MAESIIIEEPEVYCSQDDEVIEIGSDTPKFNGENGDIMSSIEQEGDRHTFNEVVEIG